MDEKFWQRFEETLDRKLDEKLEEKLEEKLDKKLDEKLDQKFEENNNKLIQYIDGKHESLKEYVDEKNKSLIQYIDERLKEEHRKTVSDVSRELGRIVDILGVQIEEVQQNQKNIMRDIRETRKGLSARLDFHEYRLDKLEEKVG